MQSRTGHHTPPPLEYATLDHLEAIDGLGPRCAARLYAAGIQRFYDLATCTPTQLAAIVQPPPHHTPAYTAWIAEAWKLIQFAPIEQPRMRYEPTA